MKLPDIIVHEEKVAHCSDFPLRVVIAFEGCTLATGKLFTQASLKWKSCSIKYFADGAVMESGAIVELTHCPGCSSPLPKSPKAS